MLGIALVTLGDDIGSEMALRTFDHLLHYGDLPIRRCVCVYAVLGRGGKGVGWQGCNEGDGEVHTKEMVKECFILLSVVLLVVLPR